MAQENFNPDNIYHVFNRGNNKENMFFEQKNYYYFLNLIEKYLLQISDIYCFCLLKNHFHILLKIKNENEIPEKYKSKIYLPFSHLFNAYTKSINKAYNRTGSLFQEHLHKNIVLDEEYLLQLVAYIHLNPVKHKFTDNYKNYQFSSYKDYKNNTKTFVKKQIVLDLFKDFDNFEFWHDLNKIKYEEIINEIELLDY